MSDSHATTTENSTSPLAAVPDPDGFRGQGGGRLAFNALWVLRLRWVAVVGQILTIGIVYSILKIELPLAPLLLIVGITAFTNAAFVFWLRSAYIDSDSRGRLLWLLGSAMTLDLISLTALLYFTGGPANPFAIFYIVNLALAAIVLPARGAWLLTAVALVSFAGLFFDHQPLAALNPGGAPVRLWNDGRANLPQIGLLIAFTTCICVVVYFATRVTEELRRRERALRLVEQQRARSGRLEALATLAAGAAHELATPLSTIAVVAKELSRLMQREGASQTTLDDVALIRSELDVCRKILDRMAGRAGQAAGEELITLRVDALVPMILEGLRRTDRLEVRGDDAARERFVVCTPQGLAQALRGVVQNALDACEPSGMVEIRLGTEGHWVRMEIHDEGPGMPADVLERAGEPFFTTKGGPGGMGLGLFLARSVVERLGGKLRLSSVPRRGTTAIVELPTATMTQPSSQPATPQSA